MITELLTLSLLAVSLGATAQAVGFGDYLETPSASIDTSNIDDFYGNYMFAYQPSGNLIDYAHRLVGKSFTQGGVLNDHSSRWSSYFPVKPSTTYTRNNFGVDSGLIAFDENGNYLRWFSTNTTFTTEADTYFIGCTAPNSSTEPMFFEGSVLPDSYVAYSCQYVVQTPYHSQIFDCWYDYTTREMNSTSWSDSNFSIGLGYMNFYFDNRNVLFEFMDEFQDGIDHWSTQFVNISFEPNSEGDYEVGMPIEDPRVRGYAFFPVGDTRHSCNAAYTGCHWVSVENDPVVNNSGYTPFSSSASFTYQYPSNPYVVKIEADDGYYLGRLGGSETFVIGGNCTIRGIQGAEAYPGTGNELIKSAYVFFDLPLNGDSTITFSALARPTHSVVLQLNDATGEYLSGSANFYEGEGFVIELTADDGHGFNSQTNSIFVNGAGEYHILYTEPLVGSLYKSVMVELTGGATNITITATALPYTQDYAQGFDNGRVDGMNNASMFAWIKTVFDGMSTFFNITILPGISLGFLAFGPLLVVAIVAIVRIIRRD